MQAYVYSDYFYHFFLFPINRYDIGYLYLTEKVIDTRTCITIHTLFA